jgi:hypothetical protein
MAVGRVEYVPKLASIFVKAIKGYPCVAVSHEQRSMAVPYSYRNRKQPEGRL